MREFRDDAADARASSAVSEHLPSLPSTGENSFNSLLDSLEGKWKHVAQMVESSTRGPNPVINLKAVGASLVLSALSVLILLYLIYAKLQSGRKTWINSTVNMDGERTSRYVVLFNLVMYCLCSSLLLVINKITVGFVPLPSLVLFLQMAATVLYIKGVELGARVEVDPLEWKKILPFLPIIAGFVSMLFTNMKALQHVPVDTFICARASTPIVIAVVEYLFLGRALPSLRSWAALAGLLVGVAAYVRFDYHFTAEGYIWIGAWYLVAIAEMVVVKHVCTSVKMTTWGRSYYMNVLALAPLSVIGLCTGELLRFNEVSWTAPACLVLAISCLVGIGMSYFSFALRALISATSFSLVGNVCKVITILVNIIIWDKHAGVAGTCALMLCLMASALYQQAPMREHGTARLREQ
mmetsp:Transcript_6554/g.15759  ORF Transcript_6554/g.15759 Transcript_6554/m.15759 type:complete len:410 (+) Transcript_6554:136-1365(+)